jgi:hypothetical protein
MPTLRHEYLTEPESRGWPQNARQRVMLEFTFCSTVIRATF